MSIAIALFTLIIIALMIFGIRYMRILDEKVIQMKEELSIFRSLLSEIRGEEEVRRILGESLEDEAAVIEIEPNRYDLSTITDLQKYTDYFKNGSTCLFATDEGLKTPVLHIVHLNNRIGDMQLSREVTYIRFKPSSAKQVCSAILNHITIHATKLYYSKDIHIAEEKKLRFIMPTLKMLIAHSEESSNDFMGLMKIKC